MRNSYISKIIKVGTPNKLTSSDRREHPSFLKELLAKLIFPLMITFYQVVLIWKENFLD